MLLVKVPEELLKASDLRRTFDKDYGVEAKVLIRIEAEFA